MCKRLNMIMVGGRDNVRGDDFMMNPDEFVKKGVLEAVS